MKHLFLSTSIKIVYALIFLFFNFIGFSQSDIQVEIIGGNTVAYNSTIEITAGNSISFRITNIRTDCDLVKIDGISITNTTDFSLSSDKVPKHLYTTDCKGNPKNVDFTITNISGNCAALTDINIEIKKDPNFIFKFSIEGSPEINVLGGSPSADILDGSTTTSSTNGTYFGVVDEGASVNRYFIIANTGSCPLDISSITSSLSDFIVPSYVLLPNYAPSFFTTTIDAGTYVILPVTFLAPISGSGTLTSTITITNTANATFTFDVSAEMFNYNIPGPGGITADFRLWLKSTRGITKDGSSKVSKWADIGTNAKDAIADSGNEPTYKDNAASNINFNPVIEFENDGSTLNQYLYNSSNGFYNQDIFIVMQPDVDVSSSTGMTIFSGTVSGNFLPNFYINNSNDVTGVGLGDFTTNLTGERLWYNQGSSASNPHYSLPASLSRAYDNAGIINTGNKTNTVSDGMRILYNSKDDALSATENITIFDNLGYVDILPNPDVVYGTPYKIGKNANSTYGNLNGRVAEIFTFAERVSDADRQKIESYLAIKYGITLGSALEAEKNYVNSFDTAIWDITANTGYNYNVAGIGRDDSSDLNQKQSKTLNAANEVTIGLNGIFATNSSNTNEFNEDGDFLVWGSNNASYTGLNTNTVSIASGITTSLTRIDRKWKIVESKESVSGGDVENVYLSIPSDAFSGFALGANEEYVLIVADNDSFGNNDIIDVLPLRSYNGTDLQTWYDFDGTKYFTFGKATKLNEVHTINIASGDYLVGESALNLNINDFTISAWVKSASNASTRTIMAKGTKLQLRLNAFDQVEVMVDDDITPEFTSTMELNDGKWHQITFVYNSGTIFLYVDGVLDKSELNVVAPSPNYNNFSVGALYVDKNTITNPFMGDIDEVYVWDQGLDENQVRYLMNQEVEKGTGDFVTGKIIPQASLSNEVATIPWSKLRAYYDFNSYCGSTVEGLSDNNNFLRIKYLNKSKEIVEDQTIALPYISASNGAWDDAGTWIYGTDNVLPNSLSLDGVTYIDWNIVETNHDIYSGDRDITLLGLINNSGTITIADPLPSPQDETNPGQSLTITNYLELDGVIDLVGQSQLIQTEGSILDADSGGYIERDQQGTANGFNYNYWTSSVSPISGNSSTKGTGVSSSNPNYTISSVLFDGTSTSSYQTITFSSSSKAADSNTPTSPMTISTYWMYKFYGPTNSYNSWIKINQNTSLKAGEGFTMKGSSGSAAISSDQNYVFKGLPYNGDIKLKLNKSSGEVDRLIGNPYPSAIDATEFILDNLSVDDGGNNTTGTVFNGALYFWDHFGQTNTHVLSGYVGGYATRNLTGGAVAISNDSRINNNLSTGTKIPGQYIPVNQGFFVSTALDGFYNDNDPPTEILTVDGGDIIFKNSQRVFATEDGSTSVFMKSSSKKTSKTTTETNKNDNPVIWLMYDSPLGYHRQITIGANEKASKGFDLGYDAFMADVNEEDMYWNFNGGKFVIQGVGDFSDTQEFSLGLVVKKGGLVRIKLDALQNIDSSKAIYIKDSITGEIYQINNEPFSMHLDAGKYNDRFKLVFKSSYPNSKNLLQTSKPDLAKLASVFYKSESSSLTINMKSGTIVSEGVLINLMGQKIASFNGFSNTLSIPLHVSTGAYIIQLKTDLGTVNKKILIK